MWLPEGTRAAYVIWAVNYAGQSAREWYLLMFVASVDISKAFTSVRHSVVIKALKFILGRAFCNSTDAVHKGKMIVAMVARMLLQSRRRLSCVDLNQDSSNS